MAVGQAVGRDRADHTPSPTGSDRGAWRKAPVRAVPEGGVDAAARIAQANGRRAGRHTRGGGARAPDPQFRAEVRDALWWLEGSGPPSDLYGDYGSLSAVDEPLFVAPSAVALSLLQIVLDQVDAHVHVSLAR